MSSASRFLFCAAGSAALLVNPIARGADAKVPLTSSFLAAHVNDKITWVSWSDDTFAKAATEHRPIYVHIGAFTSELSRAMQVQSFTNAKVYGALNQDYICILIDRDVQPDIAALFQAYLRSEKQLSGWPANVWLTGDVKPFEGATYLPPSEEWGKEGILNLIERLTPSWKNSHDTLVNRANESASNTKAAELTDKGPDFDAAKIRETLAAAKNTWLEHHKSANTPLDDTTGHLDPELLRWLLTTPGDTRKAALQILAALDAGALHDHLDGGFFHRGMTAAADFPSFQKILGDQVRLALAYLDAAKLSDDPVYAAAARSALDYVLAHLIRSEGEAIHAEDATPEDRLAGFGWTKGQIDEALGADAAAFEAVFHVKAEGNVATENDPSGKWKGRNLLVGASSAQAADKALAASCAKLLAVRAQRPAPLRDELVWIGENGLLLGALARAGEQLHEPHYTNAAKNSEAFLLRDGRMSSQWLHTGQNPVRATAEDLADLAYGFSEYSHVDASAKALAQQCLTSAETDLLDKSAGRFFAQYAGEPHSWFRPHTLDPQPGEPTPPETEMLLAKIGLGESTKDSILLNTLASAVNDPNGSPRGDVLLTATLLTQ